MSKHIAVAAAATTKDKITVFIYTQKLINKTTPHSYVSCDNVNSLSLQLPS